jgi:hypothetical protein
MAEASRRATVTWLGLAILTVAGLGWSAYRLLTVAADGPPPAGEFVVRALPAGGGSGTLWLDRVLVDGRLLRVETARHTGGWQAHRRRGETLPASLRFRAGAPAELRVSGRRLVLGLEASSWPGLLEVERDGALLRRLDLGGVEGTLFLDAPMRHASPAVLLGALAGFGLLAWFCWPPRRRRGALAWLLVVLGGVHALVWLTHGIGTTWDSLGYLSGMAELRAGTPGYFPPGYAAFLAVLHPVADPALGLWITLTQHVMAVSAGIAVFLLLRRLVSDPAAFVGGMVAGILGPVLFTPQMVMTEAPTLFAMVAALYGCVRYQESGLHRWGVAAGVLAAWATTMRVVPLAALLPAFGVLLLFPWSPTGLRRFALTAGTTLAATLVPIVWFGLASGQPKLSASTGLHLFNRVVTQQRLLNENGPATVRLMALLEGSDPRGRPHWEVGASTGLAPLDFVERSTLLGQVAREGIRQHPIRFLAYAFPLAWREYRNDASAWVGLDAGTTVEAPRLERAPLWPVSSSALQWHRTAMTGYRRAWPALGWAALAGVLMVLLGARGRLPLALAWVPAGLLLAGATVEFYSPRYNIPAVPFIVALVMAPWSTRNFAALQERLRGLRERLTGTLRAVRGRLRRLTGTGLPWQEILLPADLTAIPAMLTPEEKQYLVWLTSERYAGWGAIVDLGPWLGASSAALAEGLRRAGRAERIQSLDLFVWEPAYMEQSAPCGLGPGADFLPEFERQVAPYRRWIEPARTDLLGYRWTGGPIELLFVDAGKSWELTNAILRSFGPHLVPGKSRVILQDFLFHQTHWLPLIFDSRPDLWRETEQVEDGTTVTVIPVAPLDELAQADYGEEQFPFPTAEPLLRGRLDRTRGARRDRLMLTLYRKALIEGETEAAGELRSALRTRPVTARELLLAESVEDVLVPLGWQAYHRADYARARALAERCGTASPSPVFARALEGMASLRLGELERARACLEDVRAQAPDFLPARIYGAELALSEGDPERAAKDTAAVLLQGGLDHQTLVYAVNVLANAWTQTGGLPRPEDYRITALLADHPDLQARLAAAAAPRE